MQDYHFLLAAVRKSVVPEQKTKLLPTLLNTTFAFSKKDVSIALHNYSPALIFSIAVYTSASKLICSRSLLKLGSFILSLECTTLVSS